MLQLLALMIVELDLQLLTSTYRSWKTIHQEKTRSFAQKFTLKLIIHTFQFLVLTRELYLVGFFVSSYREYLRLNSKSCRILKEQEHFCYLQKSSRFRECCKSVWSSWECLRIQCSRFGCLCGSSLYFGE